MSAFPNDAEREAVREVANALHADACPDEECDGGDMGDFDRQAEITLDALAPHVEARVRAERAAALREIADAYPKAWDAVYDANPGGTTVLDVEQWLNDLAREAEGGDDE